MLRTIILSSRISVQGTFVRRLPNGKIVVRIGKRHFTGWPVKAAA